MYTTDCRKVHKVYSDSFKLVSTAQNTVCTSTTKSNLSNSNAHKTVFWPSAVSLDIIPSNL